MNEKNNILFILKRRDIITSGDTNIKSTSTGLYNSASYMHNLLQSNDVESNIEVVIDNNDIDKVVTKYNPTHVIIEALWVIPTKFSVLSTLHPNVKWIIRLHSDLPFLSNEGIALDWIGDYASLNNVTIAANSPRAFEEIKFFVKTKLNCNEEIVNNKVIYLPNYYPNDYKYKPFNKDKEFIDIACYGAIRPMKNNLIQAISALKFADSINKKLRFHVNSGRLEQKGEAAMKNLVSMFAHLSNSGHELHNDIWQPRDEFIELCGTMDIGMQVSLSETFNIVGADFISQGVPIIASNEIPWASNLFTASPTSSESIYNILQYTYHFPQMNVELNQKLLTSYTDKTKNIWLNNFKN